MLPIFANHILARLGLNGDDLAFVTRLNLLPQLLIEALTLRVQPMDMILGRHTISLIACRVACRPSSHKLPIRPFSPSPLPLFSCPNLGFGMASSHPTAPFPPFPPAPA